jgi:hypothetical protein
MTDENKDTKPITKALVPIDPTTGQLAPTDLEGMWRIASIMATSEMVPSDYRKKPEKCFVAMQLGMEVGLGYMAAIQTICVINGKPAIYGDGVPAIVQSRGKCKKWDEHYEVGEESTKHYRGVADLNKWPDELTAVCILEREGFDEPFEGYFSVADAKRMGKWNKPESQGGLSVWQKYPLRMLKMRARGFATRDGFSDHLKGIGIAEELQDVPPEFVSSEVVEEAPVKTGLDAVLETEDGQIVNAEYTEPEKAESPQETPLSEPEASKMAAKHPLIVELERKKYSPYLIDQFIRWAAENNDMDLVSLMNEAMGDMPGFKESMLEYAKNHKLETSVQATTPSPEDEAIEIGRNAAQATIDNQDEKVSTSDETPETVETAKEANERVDGAFEKLAEETVAKEQTQMTLADAIDESAEICEATGKVLDDAEVPDTDRQLATEDGIVKQEPVKKEPVKKADLDPKADVEAWVSRFNASYRLMPKTKFSHFVIANEAKFIQLFEYAPTIYDKAVDKFTRFYGDDPWPVVLDAERDQVGKEDPPNGTHANESEEEVSEDDKAAIAALASDDVTPEPETHKVNEAARLFKDEEGIDHREKLKRMKQLWPDQLNKVLGALKMGSGGLTAGAVEVISFALKEEIAKDKLQQAKGKK